MDRRSLLQLTLAATLAGCQHQPVSSYKGKVVIVGAGITGASIAYYLSKAGVKVIVIDKVAPASHASQGTFAWINASWAKQPHHYHSLTQDSVANWSSLAKELNIPIKHGGSLEWFSSTKRQEKLAKQIAEQQLWGEDAHMVKLDKLHELEPNVTFDFKESNIENAAWSKNDSSIDPVLATNILLAAAKKNGAELRYPLSLIRTIKHNGRLIALETNNGTIKADKLILATGADQNACQEFANIHIPQRTTAGIIAVTSPMPKLLNRIISAPGIHLHQRKDGRVVVGEQGGAPQNQAHFNRLKERPNKFPNKEFEEQHFYRMLAIGQHYVPKLENASLESMFIGWRPLPLDGHPVLGVTSQTKDTYIAIMHSGVSLAPIVGQLVAHEVSQETSIDRLDAYRPNREFVNVKRY